jgi:hypothetical protein
MIGHDSLLAHANLELVRQNVELRTQIAQMGESMIPANANARIMKRSERVRGGISMYPERGQILSLKPGETKFAVNFDNPSPTASTVCSSGCTSEVDESPRSDNREPNTVADESSEDEDRPKSCEHHRVTCAGEVHESHGTTVMMRNIPFEYTRDDILELIDRQGFNGLYDLLCLPVDFQTELNHGYVFINFVTLQDAADFKNHFQAFSDWDLPSDNTCEVTWFDSTHNIDSHIQRYRDSPLMHESVEDRFKPVLFKDGLRMAFPEPTKKIRAPRRNKRSKGGNAGEAGAK